MKQVLLTAIVLTFSACLWAQTKSLSRDTSVNNSVVTKSLHFDGAPVQFSIYKISGILKGKLYIYEKRINLYLHDSLEVKDVSKQIWVLRNLYGSYTIKYIASGTQASFLDIKQRVN